EGGYYREAATLYIQHLKNNHAAANCYERGGLYHEAIAILDELGLHERSGDLYLKLGQKEKAKASFQTCVDGRLGDKNYLDAARLLNEKMEEPGEAQKVLLQGWQSSVNEENCLKKFADISLANKPDQLPEELKQLHQHQLNPHQQLSFLNVLEYVKKRSEKDPELQETVLDLTYEIVHERMEMKDHRALRRLPDFITGDKLLRADSSRYAIRLNQAKTATAKQAIVLDKEIVWKQAILKHHSFIVAGVRNNTVCLMRGNWKGQLESYFLAENIEPDIALEFFSEPFKDKPAYLVLYDSADQPGLVGKYMPKSRNFPEAVTVEMIRRSNNAAYTVLPDGTFATIGFTMEYLQIIILDEKGEEKSSFYVQHNNEKLVLGDLGKRLQFCNGYFFFSSEGHMVTVDLEGNSNFRDFGSEIIDFSILGANSNGNPMVVQTVNGFYLGTASDQVHFHATAFAVHFNAHQISWLNASHFALVGEKELRVFKIDNDQRPVQVKHIAARSKIIAVLPTVIFNECAIFEETGEISFHNHGD
ncbi:MAG: hypothetical protein J7578_07985, partial [Chitinophagaceae bacterium]|nr:hypothetical protein [Chitinophagaceae bacterium]